MNFHPRLITINVSVPLGMIVESSTFGFSLLHHSHRLFLLNCYIKCNIIVKIYNLKKRWNAKNNIWCNFKAKLFAFTRIIFPPIGTLELFSRIPVTHFFSFAVDIDCVLASSFLRVLLSLAGYHNDAKSNFFLPLFIAAII